VPGDDIRALDWRVYGKSDRYYVKQYEEETNLRAAILLDASGSMAYTGHQAARQDGQPLSKFEYGRLLAATLAHLLLNQQDAVGLVTFDTAVRRYIPARSRASHLRVLLEELLATEPGQETALAPILHDAADRLHRRSLIFIISDLFEDAEELLKAIQHFVYRKHEVIVMHTLAAEELTFPFDRNSLFQDLEFDARRIQLDPRSIRTAYLEKFEAFIRRIELGFGQMGVDYVPMTTNKPFDQALANFLSRRRTIPR
jgi:uncharacterized protein (DUF58 family)